MSPASGMTSSSRNRTVRARDAATPAFRASAAPPCAVDTNEVDGGEVDTDGARGICRQCDASSARRAVLDEDGDRSSVEIMAPIEDATLAVRDNLAERLLIQFAQARSRHPARQLPQ